MMNRLQFLLNKLAEEAVEVAQISLKTAQFGLEEHMPGQPYTNGQRTHHELDDLKAIIEMLNDEFEFNYIESPGNIMAKKDKVNRYYQYSESLGLVELLTDL